MIQLMHGGLLQIQHNYHKPPEPSPLLLLKAAHLDSTLGGHFM